MRLLGSIVGVLIRNMYRFGEDLPVTETKPIVEPAGVGNDIWWESVALIGIHSPILVEIGDLTWQ